LSWNWDPHTWKKPIRFLLGLATIWPIIYMFLFMGLIFSGFLLGFMLSEPEARSGSNVDLIQLENKIQSGEIKELRLTRTEIKAFDREGRSFYTDVTNESTRQEIIRQAKEVDSNQRPRVERVSEETSEPRTAALFPIGFLLLFAFHLFTMLLMFLLMPLYIVLAVKNERLDQTMRIVWVVLTCTAGMLANPVYWYLYIWRTTPLVSPPAPTPVT